MRASGEVGEVGEVTVLRGEQELLARTAHLFAAAGEVACAAGDLRTWAAARPSQQTLAARGSAARIRKLYRPGVLLEPSVAGQLQAVERAGAHIRITPDEINETIILDRRIAILAGDMSDGLRRYSVITAAEAVRGVESLFEVAWRTATDRASYEARFVEVRALAPRILELLGSGCKDETAARTLGLGLRTYRRRVAEVMAALGASSRFQAGTRARELGLS